LDDGERDQPGEVVSTKSLAGERDVPILPALRRELVAHKLATGRDGDDLVFGRAATAPFIPSTVRRRARAAWREAGLEPIALHECRHTAASVMRAAGLDSKIISAMIGHSSVVITQDRYMHVDRNHLAAAAAQLDSYLAQTG
jgi:integrase